jgi:hypothetical protein
MQYINGLGNVDFIMSRNDLHIVSLQPAQTRITVLLQFDQEETVKVYNP